jgi:hygromycin-B 7''-O-kinase
MTLETLAISEAGYRARFTDSDFGLDLAEAVAARLGLAPPLARRVEGSSLVFRTGAGDWLKISPPFFCDSFEAEVEASRRVDGRLPLPIPRILETGRLEDWSFLVSAHVPGAPIGEVLERLGEDDLTRIAGELGEFMRAYHGVAVPGFERSFGAWPRYLSACVADPAALHRSRGNDAALAQRIAAFVERWRAPLEALGPPVLVHADLTSEHVLLSETGGRWHVSGVLDLADSMTAPAELDLVTPCVELFRGLAGPQRWLARAAGIELAGGDAGGLLMAVALQHRFMHFHHWFRRELAAGLVEIADIAAAVFPL